MTIDEPLKPIRTPRNMSRPSAPRAAFQEETLPDPPPAAPSAPQATERPARPTDLASAYPWLLKPFRQQDVELKPGAMTKDRTRALAMPFADRRVYFARLDKICGPEHWSHQLVLAERGAVCHLTIFGVTKSGAGDYPIDRADENAVTSAEAQAFKRACAAFGLGRYLYTLPQIWADYDDQKRQIVNAAGVVAQMYQSLPKNGDD